jgi:hypothetical protein
MTLPSNKNLAKSSEAPCEPSEAVQGWPAETGASPLLSMVFAQYKCKVAAVCTPEHHDSTCFLGTVAQNRWVDLRVFTNVEDAEEWLLKE